MKSCSACFYFWLRPLIMAFPSLVPALMYISSSCFADHPVVVSLCFCCERGCWWTLCQPGTRGSRLRTVLHRFITCPQALTLRLSYPLKYGQCSDCNRIHYGASKLQVNYLRTSIIFKGETSRCIFLDEHEYYFLNMNCFLICLHITSK